MLKVATWNVNGIRARAQQLHDWLEADTPDVVCLQEIKATADQVPALLCEQQGYWCYWHGGPKGYSGVALLMRRETFPEMPLHEHPPFDYESRIVTGRVGDLVIASVYVPNGGKDFPAKMRFIEAMDAWVRESVERGDRLLVCGDLNVAFTDLDVHPKERKPSVIGQLPEERALMQSVLGHGMVDLGRAQNPDNAEMFSWWPPWRSMRARNIGWRIDYILASSSLADACTACDVRAAIGTSDHAPVMATINVAVTAQVPWRTPAAAG